MRCSKAKKMMHQYYYQDIDSKEVAEFESHINKCAECKKNLEEITSLLKNAKPEAIPYRMKSLQDYVAGVYRKIEKKKSPLEFLILRPVLSFTAVVFVAIAIFFGIYQYKGYKEEQFIMSNYELIRNMDMLENMDMLKDLEVLQSMTEKT
jgi:asparagine synthetase B (glutamine-hydrolysing)